MIASYHGHPKIDYLWIRESTSFIETRDHLAVSLRHYYEERPHSSLGYLTPSEYAKKVQEDVA
jgi:putative transposase